MIGLKNLPPEFWKERGLRALWSALSCGILCLGMLICDLALAMVLSEFSFSQQSAASDRFGYRLFFWCVEYLVVAGLFAPPLSYERKAKLSSRLKSFACSADHWLWSILFTFLVVVLPPDLRMAPATGWEGEAYGLWWKLVLFAVFYFGQAVCVMFGGGMVKGERNHHPMVVLGMMVLKAMGIFLISVAAACVLPAVSMALLQLGAVARMLPPSLWLSLGGGALLVYLLLFALRYRKLRRFLKRLKKLCSEKKYRIKNEKTAFFNVALASSYCGFDLEAEGRSFSCRVCGFWLSWIPAVFGPKKKGFRLFAFRFAGATFFRWKKPFDFSVEGEGEKIVILCPCPKSIFVPKPNGELEIADNGENPPESDVTLYASDAFFNMVDRSVFYRRSSKSLH